MFMLDDYLPHFNLTLSCWVLSINCLKVSGIQIDSRSRTQMFSASSYKEYSNDSNSDSSFIPDNDMGTVQNCLHADEDYPAEHFTDDIEKSVHLNKDGSMTVEMRVRFKIKKKETIKWTTTVSHAGTPAVIPEVQTSDLNNLPYKNPTEEFSIAENDVPMQQICTKMINQNPANQLKTSTYDIWQDQLMNTESRQEIKNDLKLNFCRPPTPGPRKVRQKKALVESVTVVSDTSVQKKMVGQFSVSEEMDNGKTKSKHCMITHATSQITNVTHPKISGVCNNHTLNQTQTDQEEKQMLSKSTIKKSYDLPEEDVLLHNVLEKSVVEKGLPNSLTPEGYSSIGQGQSLVKRNNISIPCLSNKCDAVEQELNSFTNQSEWSQLKTKEIIYDQCEIHHCSSSLPPKSNNTICKCCPMTPKLTGSDYIASTLFSDESQATSSSDKKKKKKKKNKLDIVKQNVSSPKDSYDISIQGTTEKYVNTCTIHNTREKMNHFPTELAIYKRELAFPVGNSDGAIKTINTRGDLYSPVSIISQQNDLEDNINKNLNSQLSRQNSKSMKAEDLLLIKDNTKHEFEQIEDGTCKALNKIERPPTSLKPLSDSGNGQKAEDKKGKIISTKLIKSSSKHKEVKKKKKSESATGSIDKVLDEMKALDTLGHSDFTNEITKQSLENYIQTWLQNVYPKAESPPQHLAPINSINKKSHHPTVKSFLDKGNKETGRNNIPEDQQKSTLNNLSEVQALEESFKELYETHRDCLRNVDGILKDEDKYLMPSDTQEKVKLSLCDIIHKYKKKLQEETDHTRCNSEINAQVDPESVPATEAEKYCKNSLLLHKLKSEIFNLEKTKTGFLQNLNCLSDIFSSLLVSPSNLLLVWLLLNLKECLPFINKDEKVGTSCSCSEISMLSQYLKQVLAKEEDEKLMTAASDMQDCTANSLIFSGVQLEKQELTYCQENIALIETKNISGTEEQKQPNENLILNDSLNSGEVLDVKEVAEELRSSYEEQQPYSHPAEHSDMYEMVVMQNLNCTKAQSGNVFSNEDFLEENEAIPLQELEEKIPDPSLNNEKPKLFEEFNIPIFNTSDHTNGQIFDPESSQLDDEELNSSEEQKYTTPTCESEDSDENLTLTIKNTTDENHVENSTTDNLEENDSSVETSEKFSITSPQPFVYESNQIPINTEDKKSRVKLIINRLECGSHSNASSELKKTIGSPGTSDLSDYRPETDESDSRSRPSSDLSDESTDEAIYEKSYNTGYVKRTIERLYGKSETEFKPISKPCSPYMGQILSKDTDVPLHVITDKIPLFGQAHNGWPEDKGASSLISYNKFDLNTISNEYAILPTPAFSLNGEETCNADCSLQNANQHSEFKAQIAEDEGILIDKGKWLLKENHLIRKSPPDNSGMYGNKDTTSADTFFDNHSSDIPYSHLQNMELRSAMKEISSSDLEYMAKPCDNEGNYFNMPHDSDSEPFPPVPGIKCNNSPNQRKEYNTSSECCIELNSYSPAFSKVDFKLPNNRIHPLDQITDDALVRTQPTRNATSNRNRPETQDSLDRLHAICGQHCPILTALIKPLNEQIRGCAYQKASDIENLIWLPYLINKSIGKDKCIIKLSKTHDQLKISCMNKSSINIFGRHYTDNILDITNFNFNNFKLPFSLNYLYDITNVSKGMLLKTEVYKNHESSRRKDDDLDGITVEYRNNLSSYQSTRSNANQFFLGERTSSLEHFIASGQNEYFQRNFIKVTYWEITVYLKDRSVQSWQLLLIFKQKPSFKKNYFGLLVFLSILTFSVENEDFSPKKFR
ncbi:PREDICTED: oxygen-regulated protein 1-like [Thamnophis sirtalis]|uniref:Oxygen-regulated protein 1-like n=1 Tax=Thamnophis sirtalis TaxID=35019 RepID=A0A6I9YMC8_9SAUR|nr:PREDICTED: oxygen-regulated protein 1-like [Thamnophis sirtalis]